MHIPKGNPVHENLKTSYLNATALLADLQITNFTGYLQAVFPYSQGAIFLAEGRILNAIDESTERNRQGEEAIDAILLRASSPDGKISVYSHASKIIEAIAGRIEGEVVYQALDSDFTDLKKLVEKLKQQDTSRFYIEVEFSDFGDGVIYIIDGNIDGVLSLSSGEVIEGLLAYDKILEIVTDKVATFHVYRCAKVPLTTEANNVLSFPDAAGQVVKLSPKIAIDSSSEMEEQEIEEIIEVSQPIGEVEEVEEVEVKEAISETSIEIEEIKNKLTDVPKDEPLQHKDDKEIVLNVDENLDQPVEKDTEYQALVGIMTEIIQIVERVSALVTKDANFTIAFRAGLLKVTEQYPVFDPFVEDFSYQDGKIRLTTLISREVLINGLTKALKHTLDELVRMSPNSQLRERIAGALLRLEQLKQTEFEHFSISPALAEIITID